MFNAINTHIKSLIDCGATTGLSVVFGDSNKDFFLNNGFTDDSKTNVVDNRTISDLASVTKMFLTFAFFFANDSMPIQFNKSIKHYCGNAFPFIKDLTLDDLFHFNCNLVTDKMIINCNYEEARQQIYNIKPKDFSKPTYSDMPALVLGYIFKIITKMEFGDFINAEIINRYHLENTFWKSRKCVKNNYFNYDNEMVFKENTLIHYRQTPFIPNDKKAEMLSFGRKYLCGNAGLFSTAEDMSIIAKAILNRELITNDSLLKITDTFDDSHEQRFGYLCYKKSPNRVLSEVSERMSNNAFAISGFTGTYLMIDPIKNCYLFIAGNRLNNRITFTDDVSLIVDKTKLKYNNIVYNYSKEYVYLKDELRDACCDLLAEKTI